MRWVTAFYLSASHMARTVLIIEDADNVVPLEIALATLDGIAVQVLTNGREALSLLSGGSLEIAAVVTDLSLPSIDGFTLITAIRSDERLFKLPIIVVSGDTHPDVPERLRRLGADAFFSKPYSPAEIRHTLEELLHVT